MRAAIYARVSTELQEREQTIQSQLEALRKYAQDKDYEVVEEFRDEGYSGTRLDRPALDRLRDSLGTGELDVVLVHSPDRLARKLTYQGLILDELKRARVKIEFVNHPIDDSPEGKMMLGVEGLFSEYERDKIVERYRRGKLHWARNGAYMGGPVPYGYRLVRRDRISNQRSRLEIDELQAPVVRNMYGWLIEEGLSCRAIAKRLIEGSVLNHSGSPRWSPSVVNAMLKREIYKGVLYYYRKEVVERTASLRHGSGSRRKSTAEVTRPEDEWVSARVPAIVDDATWDAAQHQLQQNFLDSPRNNTRYLYLLRGLVRCPVCGGAYVGTFARGKRHYRCNRTDPLESIEGKCKGAGWVKADQLEGAVWEAITEALQQPETLLEEYRRRQAQADAMGTFDAERKQIELALKRIKAQNDRITDAYINEAMELTQYKAKMDELRGQGRNLERQLAELEKRAEQQSREKDALAGLETFCQGVALGLDNLALEEKQELLRLLVERITVVDGKVRVEAIIPLGDVDDSARLRPPCNVLALPLGTKLM